MTSRNGCQPRLALVACVGLMASGPLEGNDWPHWRGPNRCGITDESSGWDGKNWVDAKPSWVARVGEGASAPVISGRELFAIGWENDHDIVRCLDALTGAEKWRQSYASPRYGRFAVGDQGFYRGATATPELDPETGILYTLSCDGSINAWNTRARGRPLWSLNLYDRFGIGRRPQITSRKNTLRDYGYTCSPMVWGDWLIVETGDQSGGTVKAFDKKTGELRWSSQNRDPAGHSGGFATLTIDGAPCLAVATSWNALVLRLDDSKAGQTVAEFEWKTDFSNTIAGVAAQGQDLLITSRYNQMAMARITVSLGGGAKEIWRNRYPSGVCTPVIHGGDIYFANKGVYCVDFATGNLKWEGGKIGDAGSCYLTKDARLVVWGNGGDLFLVEGAGRSPDRCVVLATRGGVFADMAWPHVAAAGGKIYCKTLSGDLACFAVPGN